MTRQETLTNIEEISNALGVSDWEKGHIKSALIGFRESTIRYIMHAMMNTTKPQFIVDLKAEFTLLDETNARFRSRCWQIFEVGADDYVLGMILKHISIPTTYDNNDSEVLLGVAKVHAICAVVKVFGSSIPARNKIEYLCMSYSHFIDFFVLNSTHSLNLAVYMIDAQIATIEQLSYYLTLHRSLVEGAL